MHWSCRKPRCCPTKPCRRIRPRTRIWRLHLRARLRRRATSARENTTAAEQILMDLLRESPNDGELNQALKDLSARKTLDQGGYAALEGGQGSYRDILKDKKEAASLEQEKRVVKTEDVTERLIGEYEARLQTEPNNLKLVRSARGTLRAEKTVRTLAGALRPHQKFRDGQRSVARTRHCRHHRAPVRLSIGAARSRRAGLHRTVGETSGGEA